MKLSEAQKELIREMRGGAALNYTGGISPRCFLSSSSKRMVTVSWATIFALEKLKLIERPEYRGSFTLTEAGKNIEL